MPLAPPVVPTTPLETAEERLAHDVERLARDLEQRGPDGERLRDDERHVAVDERRVRSFRALPHHRVGCGAGDPRWLLVAAYEHLAAAYRACGQAERSATAAHRARCERSPLTA
ncbi:hypothetical protein [Patulibacter defluvii]|uniref:hypothetical protein n=1 Tax=Patulibacter defluvii TaxID=3095358 RepID=UPI002A74C992|nr:hypothetical protein [Patulibacter sp. DM4]